MAASRSQRIGTIYTRVEGLLRSGAMLPEDRPIWWDIYRAFPPTDEPTFFRRMPTDKPREIFYNEDAVKAKFHTSGMPLGTVNLKDNNMLTNSQKFINSFNSIISETNCSHDEAYEKSIQTMSREKGIIPDEKGEEEPKESFTSMFKNAKENKLNATNIKNIFE